MAKLTIIVALITWIYEVPQRREARITAAWQAIASANAQSGGSLGRVRHLELLANEGESLDGIYVAHASLEGVDLRGANLKKAFLCFTSMRNADLGAANFTGATLKAVDFAGADLTGVILTKADLRGSDFRDAIGITPDQIKQASWEQALYTEPFQRQLGMSPTQSYPEGPRHPGPHFRGARGPCDR